MAQALFDYTLRLADNALIMGHRLSQWCGHAPTLEEDLALANMALDLIGQARSLYTYAGEIEGKGRTEDDLAYVRLEQDYHNLLLVEQPNGDFANTLVRHLYFVGYFYPLMQGLCASKDKTLAAIAAKAEKELAYHLRHASQWLVRLGDGTDESKQRVQSALERLWMFTGEIFETDEDEQTLVKQGIAVDVAALKAPWHATLERVVSEAHLSLPKGSWMQSGSRKGVHSEHLGFLLSELQYMQRTHPNCTW